MISAKDFWLWFGGIWLLAGLPICLTGLYQGMQHQRISALLDTQGRTVEGMVLTKSITSSGSGNRRNSTPTYRITFRFTTAGGLMTGQAKVTRNTWDRLVEREPLSVTYLSDELQHYRVEGQASGWTAPVLMTGGGGIIATIGGFLFVRALAGQRARERLQREGIPTEATVSDVQVSNLRINRVNQCVVLYRYEDERRRTHQGKVYLSPEEAGQWKQGDRAAIRYDRTRPHQSLWIGTL